MWGIHTTKCGVFILKKIRMSRFFDIDKGSNLSYNQITKKN